MLHIDDDAKFSEGYFAVCEHELKVMADCLKDEMRGLSNYMDASVYNALSLANYDSDAGRLADADASYDFNFAHAKLVHKLSSMLEILANLNYMKGTYIANVSAYRDTPKEVKRNE